MVAFRYLASSHIFHSFRKGEHSPHPVIRSRLAIVLLLGPRSLHPSHPPLRVMFTLTAPAILHELGRLDSTRLDIPFSWDMAKTPSSYDFTFEYARSKNAQRGAGADIPQSLHMQTNLRARVVSNATHQCHHAGGWTHFYNSAVRHGYRII